MRRFVQSKVSVLAALRMVKVTGNLEMLPMGSVFNVDQQTSKSLSTGLMSPSHY